MGKNNYNGTEVYIAKLESGTKFYCNNGGWNGEFIVEDGIPKVIVNEETINTVFNDKVLNISTDSEIPKSAYVYPSAYYSKEIKLESDKLHRLAHEISENILDEKRLMKVKLALRNSRDNLDTLFNKFYEMDVEKIK